MTRYRYRIKVQEEYTLPYLNEQLASMDNSVVFRMTAQQELTMDKIAQMKHAMEDQIDTERRDDQARIDIAQKAHVEIKDKLNLEVEKNQASHLKLERYNELEEENRKLRLDLETRERCYQCGDT
jgi:hypothetical protein